MHPPQTDYARLPRWHSTAGGGPRLTGRRAGERGPLIHFLHGNGFCGGVYWPCLRGLTTDHRLVLHDLEGHGESEAPPRFSGSRAIRARVPQVMDDLGLPQQGLIAMGHSYGGALSLQLVDRQPQRYRALILLDPILLPPLVHWGSRLATRLGRNSMANGARRRRTVWPSREEARARLAGRGIYRGWTDEALDHFIDHATRDTPEGRALCCPPHIEAAIFEQPFPAWGAVSRLKLPTLLLYGAQSYPFFTPLLRRLRRLAPQVQVQAMPGGHCFMQEDPAATTAAVRAFLAGH
jgi:pimeloyl-ACP methyl ester carboxylesterase